VIQHQEPHKLGCCWSAVTHADMHAVACATMPRLQCVIAWRVYGATHLSVPFCVVDAVTSSCTPLLQACRTSASSFRITPFAMSLTLQPPAVQQCSLSGVLVLEAEHGWLSTDCGIV
jgi:hypothetical protein